ncbi:pV [bottlenose dolphin adenovirus 2]|uniref:PV n=1 Tax=bottlenose dolphin adenovirus 2 TaxID=2849592 RepID=A0A0M4M5A7_9ADEN|nr:pV [Bottlenose dolphin adenovirus 1]ALE15301.1 pV [Bottlenose dolphin adenovirus 1]
MTTRKIKQELLDYVAPEIYDRKRKTPKREPKTEIKIERVKSEDVKPIKKGKRRKTRQIEEDVEIVRETAPRRRYQWKGRRVTKVLRPGTVVVFSPGQKSAMRGTKRSVDEIMADSDILEQYNKNEGEFAYGKRARHTEPAMLMDNSNPTPSMQPITPQIPVPPSHGVKREGEVVPTVQVLAPKKRRVEQSTHLEDFMEVTPGSAVVLPSRAVRAPKRQRDGVVFADTKRVKVEVDEDKKPVKIEDIKIRDVKKVAPGIGVQTIDFKVGLESPKKMEIDVVEEKTKKVIYPVYRQHPSQMGFSKYVRPKRQYKKRKTKKATKKSRTTLPTVRYHPSITTKRPVIVWR